MNFNLRDQIRHPRKYIDIYIYIEYCDLQHISIMHHFFAAAKKRKVPIRVTEVAILQNVRVAANMLSKIRSTQIKPSLNVMIYCDHPD